MLWLTTYYTKEKEKEQRTQEQQQQQERNVAALTIRGDKAEIELKKRRIASRRCGRRHR